MPQTPDAPPSVLNEPTSKRHRLRPGRWRALIAVLVLGGLGWVSYRAKVQRDDVVAIGTKGVVGYDWQFGPGARGTLQSLPSIPKWLVDTVGPDYFGHVSYVSLGNMAGDAELAHVLRFRRLASLSIMGPSITEAQAVQVTTLPDLESLAFIDQPQITGATVARLGKLTKLKHLQLIGVSLRDADLSVLRQFPNLRSLNLSSTWLTDAGLVHLKELSGLQSLWLEDTAITAAGLVNLQGMTTLRELRLTRTRVADLKPLAGLTDLRYVVLSGAPITDDGLAPVARWTNLITLDLEKTAITDAGIDHLIGLTDLSTLKTANTQVSPERLAKLRRTDPLLNTQP